MCNIAFRHANSPWGSFLFCSLLVLNGGSVVCNASRPQSPSVSLSLLGLFCSGFTWVTMSSTQKPLQADSMTLVAFYGRHRCYVMVVWVGLTVWLYFYLPNNDCRLAFVFNSLVPWGKFLLFCCWHMTECFLCVLKSSVYRRDQMAILWMDERLS